MSGASGKPWTFERRPLWTTLFSPAGPTSAGPFWAAALLGIALPLLARLCDAPDVPVFSGLLYPFLLLPMGSFLAGMALGRHRGFCPLFPLACALCYLPMVFLLFNATALFHLLLTAVPALLGNGLAALLRRKREK